MKGIESALNRLRWVLIGLYSAALITSLFLFLALDFLHHKKLAKSFALSTRPSLIINDLRQAIVILTPAASSGFEVITYADKDGNNVFALPSEKSKRLLTLEFVEPILINPGINGSDWLGTLAFSHSSLPAIIWALSVWFTLLLLGIPLSSWAKNLVIARHKELLAISNAETKASIAKQVAHDIRSPLSALMIIEKTHKGFSPDQHTLFLSAADRIQKIAADLLEELKEDTSGANVAGVVEQIVCEKQIELGNSPIQIQSSELPTELANISSSVLSRILSNIINNSIDAINRQGSISIHGTTRGNFIELTIADTGRGMTSERIAELGKPGLNSDKTGGSGLGLAHAFSEIEKARGRIAIKSRIGSGTTVHIQIPKKHA